MNYDEDLGCASAVVMAGGDREIYMGFLFFGFVGGHEREGEKDRNLVFRVFDVV